MKARLLHDHRLRRSPLDRLLISSSAGLAALAMCALSPLTASADVVAGWDTWDSVTAPTPGVTAPGVAATASASGTGGNWSNSDSGSDPGRGSSNDGTWGTLLSASSPSTTTNVGIENLTLTNGKTDGQITFTITNNGTIDLELNSFRFDALAFRANAARDYALNVLEGSDITVGNVFTSEEDAITQIGGDAELLASRNAHDDIDLDLTGLADSTLEVGGVAIFQLAFSGGTGSGGGHHLFLDNVAVTTAATTSDKLVITSVPTNATAATDFSVTVQAQNAGGSAINVTQDTTVSLIASGDGTLSGNTGTILANTSTLVLNNVQYTTAEDITLSAVVTNGDSLLISEPSSLITIDLGPASQVVIETAADGEGVPVEDQIVVLGESLLVYAIARDAGGNFVENILTPTWSLDNISGALIQEDLVDNEDGSAEFVPYEAGAANIKATFSGLSDGLSGLLTVTELVNRWDGEGGNSNWQNAQNWLGDILPDFDNQTDLFFFNPDITRRYTYIGADITARSLTFDEGAGQITASFVLPGNTSPANLTIDTDSDTDPAEITVTSDSVDPITLGYYGTTAAGRGVMILNDDLLVTHDGSNLLTLNADITETDGPRSLSKAGTGTLVISGANSYTGNTTVTGGVLRITGQSIADAASLVIDGGVVDVESDEHIVGLTIDGVVQPNGEYGSTESGVAVPDDVNFTGAGRIIVGPPPVEDSIEITGITRIGTAATITFTSSSNVDVYRSSDMLDFGATPYAANQPSGSYTDNAADGDKFFYILVTAGSPAP